MTSNSIYIGMSYERQSGRVVVTQRDLSILQFLFEHKIASRDQINSYIFGNVSKSTINIRLKKMMSFGLVQRVPIETGQGVISGYAITQKGFVRVRPLLPYVSETFHKSDSPLHDMALVDIRQAFERKNSVKSYYTETVLQTRLDFKEDPCYRSFVDLNSDGMASIETKMGLLDLAIEFDVSRKTKQRYREKLGNYYWKEISGVLYVCSNECTLNMLHRVEREVSDSHQCDSKVFFALLDDVLSAKDEMVFTDINKHVVKFD